jgi:hypothetical protein
MESPAPHAGLAIVACIDQMQNHHSCQILFLAIYFAKQFVLMQ